MEQLDDVQDVLSCRVSMRKCERACAVSVAQAIILFRRYRRRTSRLATLEPHNPAGRVLSLSMFDELYEPELIWIEFQWYNLSVFCLNFQFMQEEERPI